MELRKLFIAFAACALFRGFAQEIPNAAEPSPETLQEFYMVASPHYYNLNPQTANYAAEAQLFSGLYEGLFSYHPSTLDAVPALAESFKISRDKRTWTFKIRENAKFSDKKPITAHSFVSSWKRLADLGAKAPFSSYLDFVDGFADYRLGKISDFSQVGIYALDDEHLVLRLVSPTEHLPKILCHHAFSVVSSDEGIYSGPFVLTVTGGLRIRLEKNPAYWDAKNVKISAVNVLLSDDAETNTILFNSGAVQWVANNFNVDNILVRGNIKFTSQFGTEFLFFKMNSALSRSLEFRNALLYAIDWETLRERAYFKAETLVLPLAQYPKIDGISDQNVALAISILKKIGYNAEKFPPVAVLLPDGDYFREKGRLIVDCWNKIGVRTSLRFVDGEEYLNAINESDAQVFSYTWIGDFADPLAFLDLFRANSNLNVALWQNAEYDRFLQEAAEIRDNAKRLEKLAAAEQALIDSSVVIPIAHTISANAVDDEAVFGWFENALDIHPLKYIRFKPKSPVKNVVMAK